MSNIGWTDRTWNPVTGCSRVSKGCDKCYAATMTRRLAGMGQKKYQGLTGVRHFNGVVKCWPDALMIPLHWRKPCMVVVNSMSDLFHAAVPTDFIERVFCTMRVCDRHTFQILTKRPSRMSEVCSAAPWFRGKDGWHEDLVNAPAYYHSFKVLPNVWLGTSVEDQAAADERIPQLQRTPAAVRFLSIEPMLGPIIFPSLQGIGWAIIGCESGSRRRPCHHAWIRSAIKQCDSAGVPVFVKQTQHHCPSMAAHTQKVSTDPADWPADLRRQEWPKDLR